MKNNRSVKILKDENGKKVKVTKVTDIEGRDYTYIEDVIEEDDLDPVGDGGSRRFNSKRDDSNFGGW
jgi:hypothetical protein